jgi:hypothetical protein
MNRLSQHVRGNAVAYLALFVALGGTSYAAVNLPAGSVGSQQIKNHSITPIKFDPTLINGTVRAWAEVSAGGRVIAGRGKPAVQVGHGSSVGRYTVRWKVPSVTGCVAIAGVDGTAFQPGLAEADLQARLKQILALVYNAQGRPTQLPFYAAVIC